MNCRPNASPLQVNRKLNIDFPVRFNGLSLLAKELIPWWVCGECLVRSLSQYYKIGLMR
ncbi:hypothetical protein [Floridanema aerugineum]|uniref:Uncharacterized protein n=1 Tax=Floridaenema aerugineum BLCC-F46 TaxID=3153654 RepID=A0ABV4X5K4_9CYAN